MGGQGGCERRTEVFVKIQKKFFFFFLGGGGVGWVGGQGGCESRIEVFLENSKKKKLRKVQYSNSIYSKKII